MRTPFFIIILLLICLKGSGQLIISANTGYGTYRMKEMKSWQQDMASSYPVSPRVDPSFPSYWFFDMGAKWLFKSQFLFGATYASGATGGRVYYSDYSGSMGSDHLLSFQSFQFALAYQKNIGKHLTFEGDLRPGITATKLDSKSYSNLGTYSETSTRFKAQNLILQPTITLSARFGPVGIQGFAGYNLTVAPGQLKQTGSPEYLQSGGNAVRADWSGVRAGGGVSFYVNRKVKPNEEKESAPWRTAIGIGLGLDYGGIGVNVLTYPGKYVGMFGGVGYALAGIGYNVGLKFRTKPIEYPKFNVFFIAMYGYNTAIVVVDKSELNRFFYGPTVGVGFDFGRGTNNGNWSLGIMLPLRGNEVDQYMNLLRAINFKNTLSPIAVSVGYRFPHWASR